MIATTETRSPHAPRRGRRWLAALALTVTLLPSPALAARRQKPAVKKTVPAATRIPVNLVGRWSGDGNAKDSANGHDGTLMNGATFAPGRFGKAFSLNGSQFVRIPFDLAFDFSPADQITVSAWVKPAAKNKYQGVFIKAAPGGPWEWGIIIDPQNHFYTGKNAQDVALSKTTIDAGRWYHVVATYDKGAVKMYVNGVLENQATGVTIGQSLGGVALGHKGDRALSKEDPDWFTGLIDEVRLYNRALPASEVQRIYKAGAAL